VRFAPRREHRRCTPRWLSHRDHGLGRDEGPIDKPALLPRTMTFFEIVCLIERRRSWQLTINFRALGIREKLRTFDRVIPLKIISPPSLALSRHSTNEIRRDCPRVIRIKYKIRINLSIRMTDRFNDGQKCCANVRWRLIVARACLTRALASLQTNRKPSIRIDEKYSKNATNSFYHRITAGCLLGRISHSVSVSINVSSLTFPLPGNGKRRSKIART